MQNIGNYENWRDSQHDRPEPDGEGPDERRIRHYTHDYPGDTVLEYTVTGSRAELKLSFSSEDPDMGTEEMIYGGDDSESMYELAADLGKTCPHTWIMRTLLHSTGSNPSRVRPGSTARKITLVNTRALRCTRLRVSYGRQNEKLYIICSGSRCLLTKLIGSIPTAALNGIMRVSDIFAVTSDTTELNSGHPGLTISQP